MYNTPRYRIPASTRIPPSRNTTSSSGMNSTNISTGAEHREQRVPEADLGDQQDEEHEEDEAHFPGPSLGRR